MKVPFVDLAQEHAAIEDDLSANILAVVRSGRYVMGERLEAFESALATYVGVEHVIGVSSGTDALLVALMALDVGPGDVVVTTPYSFYSSAAVALHVGAELAFVDIDPATYNICPQALSRWLDTDARASRTKVILPVHLFGGACDITAIQAIAEPRGIRIVEDAAQAIGTRAANGRHVGGFGELGCFSFFPTKNLGGLGDGGAVTTNDAELAARVRRLRSYGSSQRLIHEELGGNHRLDELQAAVLLLKLPNLDEHNERRIENAARYDAALTRWVTPAPADAAARHTYHQYVVRVGAERDAVRKQLAECGVETNIYYPLPLHRQPCFSTLAVGPLPVAEAAAAETIALPIRPTMTNEMQDYVIEKLVALGG